MAGSSDNGGGDNGWGGRGWPMLGGLLVVLILGMLTYYAISAPHHNHSCDYNSPDCCDTNCPPQASNTQQTNVLQPLPRQPLPEAVREWRRAAWQRDDIFAQITLGDLYSRDDSFYDPVEAYVWYFMALRDDHAYDTSAAAYPAMQQLFNHAQDRESALFDAMSLEQRLEARRRLIYILAGRGADGFITLGRLHRDYYSVNGGVCRNAAMTGQSSGYGASGYGGSGYGNSGTGSGDGSGYGHGYDPSGSWWSRMWGWNSGPSSLPGNHLPAACTPPLPTAIVLSNADALMYFDIALQMGHPLAPAYVADQENLVLDLPHGNEIITDARSRARTWHPDLEFYQGQTRGGTLHSDESLQTTLRHQAFMRIAELPQVAVLRGLLLQSPAKLDPPRDPRAMDAAVRRFQESLQDDVTGILTPEETVRLVQMAAVNGDAQSQVFLGIMYTKGIGVPRNTVRAAYWFGKADLQGDGEATYYLGVLYKVGAEGIPHDSDKASRLFTEAALRGFNPSRSLMLDLLSGPLVPLPHDNAHRPEHHHEHHDHHRRPL